MKVSVIIPTYNRENLLLKAIKSVLNQTYPVFEILICDDGSTDRSKEQIKSLNNPNIKWIEGKHSGLPAVPRNRGLKESMGDWVAFLDSDDIWIKDKIKKQVTSLNKNLLMSSTNATRLIGGKKNGSLIKFTKNRISFENLVKNNLIVNSSVIVNKKIIDDLGGFSEKKEFRGIEDYLLWLKIATVTKIGYLDDDLVIYRDEPDDSVRGYNTSEKKQRKTIFKSMLLWNLKEKNFNNSLLCAIEFIDSAII